MFKNAGGKLRSLMVVIEFVLIVLVLFIGAWLADIDGRLTAIVIPGGLFIVYIWGLLTMARLECYENVYRIMKMMENAEKETQENNKPVSPGYQRWVCPKCNQSVPIDDDFCSVCGTKKQFDGNV